MASSMNSSQRRQSKRGFPHSIKLVAGTGFAAYFEHDDKVMVARNWCKWNCRDGFTANTFWDHTEFKFASEKDAVMFALKWL
jgi:hypothetical protein